MEAPAPASLRDFLDGWRLSAKWSIQRFADEVGVHQSLASKWLHPDKRRRVTPSRPRLRRIAVLTEWQGWLRSKSTGRRGGMATEKQGVMTLKTWARFLADNDIFSFDPLGRLKIPRVPKIHRKPFSEDEARRLVQAASAGPNPIRDRALLLLLLDTGCRVGELCATCIQDVDLVEGAITFNRTKSNRPRRVIFRVPARRDGGPCLSALRNWLKVREARIGIDALFTTRERLPLSPRRVREIFSELGAASRVPNAHPHRCRHSAASEFLAQRPGAENQLRSRLGQISRQVLDDYVTWTDRSQEEAAAVASLSARWSL